VASHTLADEVEDYTFAIWMRGSEEMEQHGDDVDEREGAGEEAESPVWMRLFRIAELQLGCSLLRESPLHSPERAKRTEGAQEEEKGVVVVEERDTEGGEQEIVECVYEVV
jgi:hypothetical protein